MKRIISLLFMALVLSACGKTGMSADVDAGENEAQVQGTETLPDYDFTDLGPAPDLDVPTPDKMNDNSIGEVPDETTTTTTTVTTTTIKKIAPVTTTTLKPVVTTTTTIPEIVVIAKRPPKENGTPDLDLSTMAPGISKDDFVGSAILTPTIFYKPIYNENSGPRSCSAEEKVSIWIRDVGAEPKELTKVCEKNYRKCKEEGSCVIVQGDKRYPLNIVGYNSTYKKLIFMLIDIKRCPYGYGPSMQCLDPYYSVAADLSLYKEGDVIYVPAIAGTDMGNGTKHHGFFIIRDSGGSIKGRGRFDFFTGYQTDTDPKNLFKKFKLGDTQTDLKYYLVKNPSKLNTYVKRMRNYPNLPQSLLP